MFGISSLSSLPSVTPPIITPQADNNLPHPPLSSEADNLSHNDGERELLQKFQALQATLMQQSNLVARLNNQLLREKEENERLRSQFHLQFNQQFESRGAVDTSYSVTETAEEENTTTETAVPETGNLDAFRELLQTTVGSLRAKDEAHRAALTRLQTQHQRNEELKQTFEASNQEKINQFATIKKEAALETKVKNEYQQIAQTFIDVLENKKLLMQSRCEVAFILGDLPELYDDIRIALEKVLQDESEDIQLRTEVVMTLGEHRALSHAELSLLFEILENKTLDRIERLKAVWTLESQLVVNKAPELIEAICLALQAVLDGNEEVAVKTDAAIALGQHQALLHTELSLLLDAVKDTTFDVAKKNHIVFVLSRQLDLNKEPGPIEAIRLTLQDVLQDEDKNEDADVEVKSRARAALDKFKNTISESQATLALQQA